MPKVESTRKKNRNHMLYAGPFGDLCLHIPGTPAAVHEYCPSSIHCAGRSSNKGGIIQGKLVWGNKGNMHVVDRTKHNQHLIILFHAPKQIP